MSLKLGNTPIAGISTHTNVNAHHLLDFKWTDCIMNDVSWLRADTFSWQSGDVFVSAYNHLVQDIQDATTEYDNFGAWFGWYGISGTSSAGWIIWTKTPEPKVGDIGYYNTPHTATCIITSVTDTTITISNSELGTGTLNRDSSHDENPSQILIYRRATDGHKICLADQETTIANIYSETGIAWYYILDTTNTQFKLPRTKYGFEGLRTNVGDKIDESLPNIKGGFGIQNLGGAGLTDHSGAFYKGYSANYAAATGAAATTGNAAFDASLSSSTYQNNAPVQERATQMYLYFYVGDYSQTAIEQTAGLNSELFNNKVDLNASNLSSQGMNYIAGMGMPSDKYIDLTLNASGSTYTAPANGWFFVGKTAGESTRFLEIINTTSGLINSDEGTTQYSGLQLFIPAQSGDIVQVNYNASGNTFAFKFIYAQGSESEAS